MGGTVKFKSDAITTCYTIREKMVLDADFEKETLLLACA